MLTSPDTLIRLVRQTSDTNREIPRVLGIDDWAKRKGQSYGTILVDLENHEVVDLLPSGQLSVAWQTAVNKPRRD